MIHPGHFRLTRAAVLAFGLIAAAALTAVSARAETFPGRPIHLFVPYPPGGPNDVIARLLAQKLQTIFNQSVIVENRAGGSGNIAIVDTVHAAPDGYTIVLPAMAYAVNPSLFIKIGYTFDQIAPVSIVTQGPLVLVVHPSLGVKSVKDLIALAKKEPGKLNYGSGGNGSSLHLAGEMFKQQAKVDIVHVPYKGTNDLIPDLLSGRVPIAFISPLIAKAHVAKGELIPLAVTSARRSPSWPDIPTIAEAGVPGYDVEAWYAILAPAATPKSIVDALSRAVNDAVRSPEVSDRLINLGNEPVGTAPEEAKKFIADEAERWHGVLTAAGIHAD